MMIIVQTESGGHASKYVTYVTSPNAKDSP